MISVDDSSSEDGEDDSDDADAVHLLLRGKHGDTDDEGIERDHDAGLIDVIDLEQPQQSSLESESSSTSTSAGRQPGRQRQRQHRRGGGETDSEVVATDGSIEKVLSLCCNHLVSPDCNHAK